MVLFSLSFTAFATPYQEAQDFLANAFDSMQEHQTTLFIAGASAATAAYIAYAIYLDGAINDRNSLWHWAIHHIKDGIIDQDTLIRYVEDRYPDLKTLHPLTAIFATAHAAQMEIDICLTLRSVLKNLKSVRLEWVMSESIASLDKKLECLYILKIMLSNCTTETRSRCKKRAQLV